MHPLILLGHQLLEPSLQGTDLILIPHREGGRKIALRDNGNKFPQPLEATLEPQAEEERAHRRSQTEQERARPQQHRAVRGRQRVESQDTGERNHRQGREEDDEKKDPTPPAHRH